MEEEHEKEGIGLKIRRLIKSLFGIFKSKSEVPAVPLNEGGDKKSIHKKANTKKHGRRIAKKIKRLSAKPKALRRKAMPKQIRDNLKKDNEEKIVKKEDTAKRKEIREEFKKIFSKNKTQKKEAKNKKEKTLSKIDVERSKVFQEDIDKALSEWALTFPSINLDNGLIDKIRLGVYKELSGKDISKEKIEKRINFAMRAVLSEIILPVPNLTKQIKEKKEPFLILFTGQNNSGKTFSLAKAGRWLQKKNISCLFAASDTQTAETIAELEKYARELNLPITKADIGADPSEIAAEAKKYAKEQNIQGVLIDTFGGADDTALNNIKKIIHIAKPDAKLFVVQSEKDLNLDFAKSINREIGIDGLIVTRADLYDEKSTVLNLSHELKKPVYFIGIGPDIDDLTYFDKEDFLKKLKLG